MSRNATISVSIGADIKLTGDFTRLLLLEVRNRT